MRPFPFYFTTTVHRADSKGNWSNEGFFRAKGVDSQARRTQQGELLGIPPTGKQVTLWGVVIDRIAGGKLVETWLEADILGMRQQLGVVPAPEGAGA